MGWSAVRVVVVCGLRVVAVRRMAGLEISALWQRSDPRGNAGSTMRGVGWLERMEQGGVAGKPGARW